MTTMTTMKTIQCIYLWLHIDFEDVRNLVEEMYPSEGKLEVICVIQDTIQLILSWGFITKIVRNILEKMEYMHAHRELELRKYAGGF